MTSRPPFPVRNEPLPAHQCTIRGPRRTPNERRTNTEHLGLVLLAALSTAASPASAALPVEVEAFKAPKADRELADTVTVLLRRALDASGVFEVVRTDLHTRIAAKQRRLLGLQYEDEGGPVIGELQKPEVLVTGRARRKGGQLDFDVEFTDLTTGKTLPGGALHFEAPADDLEQAFPELVARIALRVQARRGEALSESARDRIREASAWLSSKKAQDAFRDGEIARDRFDYPALSAAALAFQSAVEADPGHVGARIALAETWLDLGLLEVESERIDNTTIVRRLLAAEAQLQKAEALAPDSDQVKLLRARLEAERGDRAAALAILRSLPQEIAETAAAAHAWAASERIPAVRVRRLERAVEAHPGSLRLRILFSKALVGAGRLDEARGQTRYVLSKLAPAHVPTLRRAAVLAYYAGRFTESRRLAEKGLELDPENPALRTQHAFAVSCLRQRRKGGALLAEALSANPRSTRVPARQLVDSAAPLLTEALEQMARLRRRWPKHTFLGFAQAYLQSFSARRSEVEAGVAALLGLEKRTKLPALRIYAGLVASQGLRDLNRHEEALAVLDRVLGRALPPALEGWARLTKLEILAQAERFADVEIQAAEIIDGRASEEVVFLARLVLVGAALSKGDLDRARADLDEADRFLVNGQSSALRVQLEQKSFEAVLTALGKARFRRASPELLAKLRDDAGRGIAAAAAAYREGLRRGLAGNPSHIKIAARLHERLGLKSAAMDLWKKLPYLAPAETESYAEAILRLEGPEALVPALSALVAEAPSQSEYRYSLGAALMYLNQPARAQPVFEVAFRQLKTWRHGQALANLHLAHGEAERAFAVIESVEDVPELVQWQRRVAYRLRAGHASAPAQIQQAIEAMKGDKPKLSRFFYSLGHLLKELDPKATEQRSRMYLTAVQMDPQRTLAWLELAELYIGEGKIKQGQVAIARGLQRAEKPVVIQAFLALKAQAAGGFGAVVLDAARYAESHPSLSVLAARAAFEGGDLSAARRWCTPMLSLPSVGADVWELGGKVYDRAGDAPRARALFRLAALVQGSELARTRESQLDEAGVPFEIPEGLPDSAFLMLGRKTLAETKKPS